MGYRFLTAVVLSLASTSLTTTRGVAQTIAQVPSLKLRREIVVGARLRHAATQALSSAAKGSHVSDIEYDSGRLLVVDTENDRVVVLDTLLRSAGSIGRSGTGEGELQIPLSVRISRDAYVVSDFTNRRLSYFRRDGSPWKSVPLENGVASFAAAPSGTVYMIANEGRHYAWAIDSTGQARAFGSRHPVVTPSKQDLEDGALGLGTDLIAAAGSQIAVFDNRVGALLVFDSLGGLHGLRSLPRSFLEPARERRREVIKKVAASGRIAVAVPLVKHLSVVSSHHLLLLFSGANHFGLLIDLRDYSARPLRAPSDEGQWKPLDRAVAGAMRNNTLYVADGSGVHAYRFDGRRR